MPASPAALGPAEPVLDALGNGVRRDILALLREGPRAVGSIAAELPVSRPAVSRHLRQLEGAGLVRHRSAGNKNLFELDRAGFEQARAWLDSFWDVALRRFAMVAESLPESDEDASE